jgi:hypothetical protein
MAPSKRPLRRPPQDEPDTGRRPSARDEDDDDEDEEEDEAPRKSGAKGATPKAGKIRGGWSAGQQNMDSASSFAQTLRIEDTVQAIKFLEDTPYANWRRHWIEVIGNDGKKTSRSYTCLQSVNKDCPVCDAGDKVQAVASFNVAVIGDDGDVMLKSWDTGPRLFQVLKGYANDTKVGPLTKGYFLVSKTGKKGTVSYNVIPVRATLEEDYDIVPPDQSEFDRLGLYDDTIIDVPTVKTMKELALGLSDYDED